jgi:hypothetical protein
MIAQMRNSSTHQQSTRAALTPSICASNHQNTLSLCASGCAAACAQWEVQLPQQHPFQQASRKGKNVPACQQASFLTINQLINKSINHHNQCPSFSTSILFNKQARKAKMLKPFSWWYAGLLAT